MYAIYSLAPHIMWMISVHIYKHYSNGFLTRARVYVKCANKELGRGGHSALKWSVNDLCREWTSSGSRRKRVWKLKIDDTKFYIANGHTSVIKFVFSAKPSQAPFRLFIQSLKHSFSVTFESTDRLSASFPSYPRTIRTSSSFLPFIRAPRPPVYTPLVERVFFKARLFDLISSRLRYCILSGVGGGSHEKFSIRFYTVLLLFYDYFFF